MNDGRKHQPPRWAERLLTWYCKPELLEDLQGDLNEYFERNIKWKGRGQAKLIYVIDVFKFFRLYTIRKPEFVNLLINWIMLGSYIKTSGRNIVRNKLFSTINIAGLAISMSVGLLMIAFLSDLFSYDNFHQNKDRIYRVIAEPHFNGEGSNEFASTSVKTAKLIEEKIAGVEKVVIVRRGFVGDAISEEKIIQLEGLWANEAFFSVFTLPLVQGNPSTALKEPYSIVLTERAAMKIWGNSDALGKSIKFDTISYQITGVMKDPPWFSHMRFEALCSFSTKEIFERANKKGKNPNKNFFSWTNMWQNYVYVLLPENNNPATLQVNLDKLSEAENAHVENTKIFLHLQPLKEIALGKDLSNPIGPTMMVSVVWVIAGLACIVILSACFNYTNLSMARSLRRSREVGIRKVIGAQRGHVLSQFITESVIISLLALLFSFVIFIFLRPRFLSIAPELGQIVTLDLSVQVITCFIIFAIVVGFLAGFLPALFFSRINVTRVLKDVSSMIVFRQITTRKALIVVQYTISLIFITAAIIGYRQYKNFLSFDLGFNTENILNIKLQGNKSNLFIKELSEISEITGISKSAMITSVGNYYGADLKYHNPNDSIDIWYNSIDEQYLLLHGHKLIAGKNFTHRENANAEETEVIVNERVVQYLGLKSPERALGETVTIERKALNVIGVLKDFHYGKVDNKIDPVVFRYLPEGQNGYVNVKIASTNIAATMASIEHAWRKIDRVHPMDAAFYDDQIERAYSEFSAMLKIIGFLAFLAISIASMGLFGMVVFTTETKLKEISIRKVMGASEPNLIYLLSRGFIFLLSVSALIALPATYFFFERVVLPAIAYHLPIEWLDLVGGFAGVMLLAVLMIGSQTLKVARSNPAEVLKNE